MKINKKRLLISIVIVAMLIISAISYVPNKANSFSLIKNIGNDGNIAVHFLDVGQGDSEFIELPDNRCMLIDAGVSEHSQTIIDYIENCGYSAIDYVVATHPHADHIGGMSSVIEHFDIGEIYMPKALADTRTFEKLLDVVSNKGLKIKTAYAGNVIYSDSSLEIKFLSPVKDKIYDDLNNYSSVVKITYGADSYIFTGDAEKYIEEEMLKSFYNELDCDILKVGHHGSKSSSSEAFIDAVSPVYAVISCGANNSYNHPHKEALQILINANARVYRTDKHGTVIIKSDGEGTYNVESER